MSSRIHQPPEKNHSEQLDMNSLLMRQNKLLHGLKSHIDSTQKNTKANQGDYMDNV